MKNKNIFTLMILPLLMACHHQIEEQKVVAAQNENIVTLTDAQLKNATIEITSLQQKSIATVLKLYGVIDVPPQNLVSVSVPLGGYLKSTKLLPGMHIRKGEIIAIIEDQQFIQLQQDYLLAKSKLHFATLEYNRQKELNQSQASSDKATQQAQSEMQNQQILLNTLSEKLKLININTAVLTENTISKSVNVYASIDGFVSKVNVNIGRYVSPTDVLFELVNPSDIHLNLKVFEKDISKINIGQKAIAYTNTNNNLKYACEIILISKDISPDGTTEVHCHFEQYDKNLLPGMYMNAEIELGGVLSNSLPEYAIVNYEGKNFVFVETKKQEYEITEVEIGKSENGYIEILNVDKIKNKNIVSTGAYALLMKMKNVAE